MIDKIKHHRAYVFFLKFLKLLMIPTMQEIGGISKGHILTAYQNGSVNVSKLKIPINSKPQKEVAINTGRFITALIIPWTRNEFLLSFIFSQISYTMCAYFSSYICNVGQFVKFLFTVLFYRQFRICITNALDKAHTPIHYITNQQRKQELYSDFVGVIWSRARSWYWSLTASVIFYSPPKLA